MDQFKRGRKGRYRPKVSKRICDEQFNEIFAGLKYHRDRALLAFWVSTGARAEELLDSFQGDVYPGDQLISVTRKGSRDIQQIPASPDAFVWLRLYQEEIWKRGAPRGRDQPLWFTLRRPFRPLTYAAARAMFQRANELLGSNWGIHDLRHTAAWRMAQDPEMSITDVQWILAHASLETTQLYTAPDQHEVIVNTRAYHQRRASKPAQTPAPPAPGYNPESLRTLFGDPSRPSGLNLLSRRPDLRPAVIGKVPPPPPARRSGNSGPSSRPVRYLRHGRPPAPVRSRSWSAWTALRCEAPTSTHTIRGGLGRSGCWRGWRRCPGLPGGDGGWLPVPRSRAR
ncbi:site-specific integrase [Acrocarpospora corrugata]